MLIERLGEVVDMDPRLAALDESIVAALRRWGPSKQRDLWYRSRAQFGTREEFHVALDRLVEGGFVVRQGTNRVNSFIFRVSPDRRRRGRVLEREAQALPQKGISVTEPGAEEGAA